MKISKTYNTVDDLAQELVDIYTDGQDFVAVCLFKTAQKLVKRLLQFDNALMPYNIEMASPEWDNYCDEFIVANVGNGLLVEPARRGDDRRLITIGDDDIPIFCVKGECGNDVYDEGIIGSVYIDAVITDNSQINNNNGD